MVQSLLNQLGIVCSYDKSLGAICNFGLSQVLEMQEKVAGISPFMLFWDNLVRTEKKEEVTLYNRRVLLSMTSEYVQFLHIPPPPLSATNPNSPNHWMIYIRGREKHVHSKEGSTGHLYKCPGASASM